MESLAGWEAEKEKEKEDEEDEEENEKETCAPPRQEEAMYDNSPLLPPSDLR